MKKYLIDRIKESMTEVMKKIKNKKTFIKKKDFAYCPRIHISI
jgi:hypothetical protein